jgi:small subunit ribosomal protein S13
MKYFFSDNKKLNEIIMSVFGVGAARSVRLLREVGACSENIGLRINKISSLNNERMDLKLEDFVIGDSLKQKLAIILLKYKQSGCYRGVRILQSLPCRGQRTKRNSKTAKRLKHFEIDSKNNMITIQKTEHKKEQRYKNENKPGKFKFNANFKSGKPSDVRNLKRLAYSRKLKFEI